MTMPPRVSVNSNERPDTYPYSPRTGHCSDNGGQVRCPRLIRPFPRRARETVVGRGQYAQNQRMARVGPVRVSDSWRNAFSESSYLSLRCGVRHEPGVRAVGKEMFGDRDRAAAVIDRIVHHGRIVRLHSEPNHDGYVLVGNRKTGSFRPLGTLSILDADSIQINW